MTETRDTAEQLLEIALKSGAEAAEVYESQSLSHPVFFEANRLKQLESSQSEGVALRLWKQGRPGLAVAYGPTDLQALVEKALALSELKEPEAIELNPGSKCIYPDLGKAVAVEELVNWGKEAIAQVRQAYPEVLCTSQWDCEVESTRLINTLGLDYSYSDTTLSCFLSAEWVRGEDFLSVGDGQTQRGYLEPEKVVKSILQRLDWAKNNVDPPTGRIPVLLTAQAADLLWGTVQAALNGKQVEDKSSPWSDRAGEPVISPYFTLTQAPDRGPFSCPFDDEGTPTRHLTLIDKGKLQTFYCDRTTAHLLGTESTGNGFRPGLGGYPTPGLVNLLIQPGRLPLGDLIRLLDNGLIVDQMLGGGAGISGEFSINVDLGYRIEKGEIVGRIKDTMVSGNVYSALNQVVALGNDADWNGACYTPSVTLEGLSVTGR
ncbi:TldD/PmbA family protein [Merismopedia glauca]|uniref:Peptidase C69 n=1 Tax=Merismopedia glauca CCAP 1448/3 TaxID=1296344 RepID=A0A2T1BYB2_9CYAN|nr:TldD/PmbA family protein [Merismopedia glauca]PSB00863.1 peptidase C69 [Merismopedia glauca CCAP 1448/3]